jgi:hypothetical protein
MWLWLSAFAVLQGGALDAAIESQMLHDASSRAKAAAEARR